MNITQEVIDYIHNAAKEFPGLQKDSTHPGYRDEVDAFRHAYMSALLTVSLGPDLAKMIMSEYEKQHPNTDPNLTPEEREMDSAADEFNNRVGRDIALDWMMHRNVQSLKEAIYNAVKGGVTINNPAIDTREYVDSGYTWSTQVDSINSLYLSGRNWAPSGSPLVIDLDGDGIETVGIQPGSPILFDNDADGIKTGTGWIKPDDGLLVLDRDGNGTIDTGRELFGVQTLMSNAEKAADGFAALRDLDTNADGKFNASDAQFSNVKVWQDANQDGVSQANELKSLSDYGITSIDLNAQSLVRSFGDGNTSILESSVEGIAGKIYDVNFTLNSFYSEFTSPIPLTEQAQSLPVMEGSGMVRDLQEAASLSPALTNTLEGIQSTTTRAQLTTQIGNMLEQWADTSSMKTSIQQAYDNGFDLEYLMPGMTPGMQDDYFVSVTTGNISFSTSGILSETEANKRAQLRAQQQEITRIISILERFNGITFVDMKIDGVSSPSMGYVKAADYQYTSGTGGINVGRKRVYATLTQPQIDFIRQSYSALNNSVYEGIVLQTRLKPYLDSITLDVTEAGIAFNFDALYASLEALKQTDPKNALIDLLELDAYAGSFLRNAGLLTGSMLTSIINNPANSTLVEGVANEVGVRVNGYYSVNDLSGFVFGGSNTDTIYGNNADDVLFGMAGDDVINGFYGDDILDGGAGDDNLQGGPGNDTYRFGVGSGVDTIYDYDGNNTQTNTIEFGDGITQSSIELIKDDNNLRIKVSPTDSLILQSWFSNNYCKIDQFKFADGTILTAAQLEAKGTKLHGTAGADNLYGSSSDDIMYGYDGNDYLYGNAGNDIIDGGTGVDNLQGGDGADILDGGAGDDSLQGGLGNDTYKFGMGSGVDTVSDYDGNNTQTNTIEFGAGITQSSIELIKDDNNLRIKVSPTDSLILQSWFSNNYCKIDQFKFADGTILTAAQLEAKGIKLYGANSNDSLSGTAANDAIYGYEGNDYLYGDAGADILDGGAGDDSLQGGLGNDTYKFSLGSGVDTINEYDTTAGNLDVVQFGTGITQSNIELIKEGYNLRIKVSATDSLIIQNWFSGTPYQVEQFKFADGTVLTAAQLEAKGVKLYGANSSDSLSGTAASDSMYGYEGNDSLSGNAGNDTIDGGAGTDNLYGGDGNDTLLGGANSDTLYGGAGADILDGGAGDDGLQGGLGNDTYKFSLGSGVDTINEYDTTVGNLDVVQFGTGITQSNIELIKEGYNLRIKVSATDSLIIQNWFSGTPYQVEQFKFADGTVLTAAQLEAKGVKVYGTSNAETLTGSGLNDIMYGYEGNDSLSGNAGNDIIDGGAGTDNLYGGDGNDTLLGGANSDTLYGDAGADILDGGTGDDRLQGGLGNDTYKFSLGSGIDTISDYDATVGNLDVVQFGTGITQSNIELIKENFNLRIKVSATDSLIIQSWFSVDAYKVEQFKFADGTVLTAAQLEAKGVKVYGTSNAETLTGSGLNDIMYGYEGNDSLSGNVGNDILDGGTGDDSLSGGLGNDTYKFSLGSGVDTINDYDATTGNLDAVQFGAGITQSSIELIKENFNLRIKVSATDSLIIQSWFSGTPYQVEQFKFADGTVLTAAQLEAKGVKVYGTSNAETLTGSGLNDIMYGYVGNDYLYGNAGNDILDGGAGTDNLYGGDGNDTLSGGANNDALSGDSGDDMLDGGAGEDAIYGKEGNDVLSGGADNDILQGDNGDDILDGGTGADMLYGGAGNDTYRFGIGSGVDTLYDYDTTAGNLDTVEFGEGITPNSIELIKEGQNLRIQVSAADSLILRSWFDGGYCRIEQFKFADGSTLTAAQLESKGCKITGTSGSDSLFGSEANDAIYGYEGNDSLLGYGGNDSLDGGAWDDVIQGGAGNDVLYGGSGNDNITGGVDNDIINGGPGDDYISGDAGNDIYKFELGSGIDTLNSFDYTGSDIDTVEFGTGITQSSIELIKEDFNLRIKASASDSLLIQNWFSNPNYKVDQFKFADGTILTAEQLEAKGCKLYGSASNDNLTGTNKNDALYGYEGSDTLIGQAGDDTLDGGAGTDSLNGGDGNDTLLGGAGTDSLTGGEGNDTLLGGADSDRLYGDNGNDTLDGGAGDDSLQGGLGNDTYRFNLGSGLDTINEYDTTVGNLDTVQFGTGITQSSIELIKEGYNLRIKVSATDSLVIQSWFLGTPYQVEQFKFADGSTLTAAQMEAKGIKLYGTTNADSLTGSNSNDTMYGYEGSDTLSGYAGNDILDAGTGADSLQGGDGNDTLLGGADNDNLYGDAGADTLDGGTGNDNLQGGLGNDTYKFNLGSGLDTISDYDATVGNKDLVQFGVSSLNLIFAKSSANLNVDINGTTDRLTVQSWNSGSAYQTEVFKTSDGKQLLNTQVDQLIQAMATFSANNGGISWSNAIQQKPTEVQQVLAQYWTPQA